MISLYEIFKIIFGLIISSFVLIVLFNFIGSYTLLQEDTQKAQIIKTFIKASDDVYITANTIDFDNFEKQQMSLSFDTQEPEGILFDGTKAKVHFPLFFSPGDQVIIERQVMDMGWWKFRFVEALPRMRIIFNPINPTQATWKVIEDITQFFPDSEFYDTKITFGICDGPSLQEKLCSGEWCEKQSFLFYLSQPPLKGEKCQVAMPQNAMVLTISSSCPQTGICISPPNSEGIGNVYISGRSVVYKDPLDIISVFLGGEKSDIFGYSGKALYEYKNDIFRKEVRAAAEMMSQRALLLSSVHQSANPQCSQSFSSFQSEMRSLADFLSDEEYHVSQGKATAFVSLLKNAKAAHEKLVQRGCDYR